MAYDMVRRYKKGEKKTMRGKEKMERKIIVAASIRGQRFPVTHISVKGANTVLVVRRAAAL